MIALAYLRIVVAGLLTRARRVLRGAPCPCGSCRSHRAFRIETQAAYRAAVLRQPHPVVHDDAGDVYRADS